MKNKNKSATTLNFPSFPINTQQSLRATRCGGRHKKGKLWLVGGASNNGANCGLACANSNNAWTNSNANYSARITSKKETIPFRTRVLRHRDVSDPSEPRRLVHKYSQ